MPRPSQAQPAARTEVQAPGNEDSDAGISNVAAEALAAADQEYQLGVAAQNSFRWGVALEHYRKSWALRRASYVALNLGIVEHRTRQWADAAEHLSYGLLADTPPRLRIRCEELLASARRHVTTLHVEAGPDGSAVFVDDRLFGLSPLPVPLHLDPGTHVIRVSFGERSERREIVAKAGVATSMQVVLPSDPLPQRRRAVTFSVPAGPGGVRTQAASAEALDRWPSHQEFRRGSELPAVMAFGVAGLSLVGAVTFTVLSSGNTADGRDRLRALKGAAPCAAGTPYREDCEAIADYQSVARTQLVLAGIGYAISGAGIVAGALLWPRSAPVPRRSLQGRGGLPSLTVGWTLAPSVSLRAVF